MPNCVDALVQKVNFLLAGGCEVVSTIMRVSEWYPVSPGPGEPLRTALGWTPLLRTPSSGVWLFRGAVRGGTASSCSSVLSGLGG